MITHRGSIRIVDDLRKDPNSRLIFLLSVQHGNWNDHTHNDKRRRSKLNSANGGQTPGRLVMLEEFRKIIISRGVQEGRLQEVTVILRLS